MPLPTSLQLAAACAHLLSRFTFVYLSLGVVQLPSDVRASSMIDPMLFSLICVALAVLSLLGLKRLVTPVAPTTVFCWWMLGSIAGLVVFGTFTEIEPSIVGLGVIGFFRPVFIGWYLMLPNEDTVEAMHVTTCLRVAARELGTASALLSSFYLLDEPSRYNLNTSALALACIYGVQLVAMFFSTGKDRARLKVPMRTQRLDATEGRRRTIHEIYLMVLTVLFHVCESVLIGTLWLSLDATDTPANAVSGVIVVAVAVSLYMIPFPMDLERRKSRRAVLASFSIIMLCVTAFNQRSPYGGDRPTVSIVLAGMSLFPLVYLAETVPVLAVFDMFSAVKRNNELHNIAYQTFAQYLAEGITIAIFVAGPVPWYTLLVLGLAILPATLLWNRLEDDAVFEAVASEASTGERDQLGAGTGADTPHTVQHAGETMELSTRNGGVVTHFTVEDVDRPPSPTPLSELSAGVPPPDAPTPAPAPVEKGPEKQSHVETLALL